jgi:hypothetical protein
VGPLTAHACNHGSSELELRVRPRPIPYVVAAAGMAVGSVLLASCSSSEAGPASHAVEIAPGGKVRFDLAHNARADVRVGRCTETSGAWVLEGLLKNPGTKETNFQIVVDYVTKSGSTVLATTVENVSNVAPGAVASWSATGARGRSDVSCIVRLAQTT